MEIEHNQKKDQTELLTELLLLLNRPLLLYLKLFFILDMYNVTQLLVSCILPEFSHSEGFRRITFLARVVKVLGSAFILQHELFFGDFDSFLARLLVVMRNGAGAATGAAAAGASFTISTDCST